MGVAAAIIAGGGARRLGGVAKPFLSVAGRTIADRQLDVLRPLFARVLVVVAEPADAEPWLARGLETVVDPIRGAGPLAGVAAALAAISSGEAAVCLAGDLPFPSAGLLTALRDREPGADAVAPRVDGRAEPLFARYAARLLPEVQARLRQRRLALHALLEETATTWLAGNELAALDPSGVAFLNVNTPEDLKRAEAIARSRS